MRTIDVENVGIRAASIDLLVFLLPGTLNCHSTKRFIFYSLHVPYPIDIFGLAFSFSGYFATELIASHLFCS